MEKLPEKNGSTSSKPKLTRRRKTDLFRRRWKKTDLNYDMEFPRNPQTERAAPEVFKNSYRHRNTGHVPDTREEFIKQRDLKEVYQERIEDATIRKRKKTLRANNALRREIDEKRQRGDPIDVVADHVGPEPLFPIYGDRQGLVQMDKCHMDEYGGFNTMLCMISTQYPGIRSINSLKRRPVNRTAFCTLMWCRRNRSCSFVKDSMTS